MAYIFLFIGAAWLASAMFIASKLAPAAREDDLGLVILFSVFWPVAGVAFYYWNKAQPERQPIALIILMIVLVIASMVLAQSFA